MYPGFNWLFIWSLYWHINTLKRAKTKLPISRKVPNYILHQNGGWMEKSLQPFDLGIPRNYITPGLIGCFKVPNIWLDDYGTTLCSVPSGGYKVLLHLCCHFKPPNNIAFPARSLFCGMIVQAKGMLKYMQQRLFNNLALAFTWTVIVQSSEITSNRFRYNPQTFSTTVIMSRTQDFEERETIILKPSEWALCVGTGNNYELLKGYGWILNADHETVSMFECSVWMFCLNVLSEKTGSRDLSTGSLTFFHTFKKSKSPI